MIATLHAFDWLLVAHRHLPLVGMTWTEFWDVTDGEGYQFWSGFGGSFVFTLGFGSIIAGFWHHHNCHEHGCLRLSWHPDKDGHPVCKKHHEDHPSRGFGWDIKNFIRTGHWGDHNHPRHRAKKASKVNIQPIGGTDGV